MAHGHTPSGEYTYVAEGDERTTSTLHWPAYASGVTIGKGYDMRHRSSSEIYSDLIASGISRKDAGLISKASGLYGSEAEKFAKENKRNVSPLTKAQKVALFDRIWPYYLSNTIRLYGTMVPKEVHESDIYPNAKQDSTWVTTDWYDLENKIQDVLVDIFYQGSWSKKIAKAGSKNDTEYLARYLEVDPGQNPYRSRRRPDYVRGIYSPKGF